MKRIMRPAAILAAWVCGLSAATIIVLALAVVVIGVAAGTAGWASAAVLLAVGVLCAVCVLPLLWARRPS